MQDRESKHITEIVRFLADGEFHSGEWLAAGLNISRTIVWRKMGELAELGLQVERVHGKGYRLAGGLDLLDGSKILEYLGQGTRGRLTRLDVRQSVGSTNEIALQGLLDGSLGHGTALLAEYQTQGRGRRGRSWVSPYGRNIYLSLIWRFDAGASSLNGLSLAMGVAVLRSLRKLGINRVELKWPNDILYLHAKLGGILIEMSGDMNGPVHAVVGIGLNISLPRDDAGQIDQAWTDLNTVAGRKMSRNEVIAGLVAECMEVLADFPVKGFASYRDEWQSADALHGCEVQLQSGHDCVAGLAGGVDENGALVVETHHGRQIFHGGEVTVRRST